MLWSLSVEREACMQQSLLSYIYPFWQDQSTLVQSNVHHVDISSFTIPVLYSMNGVNDLCLFYIYMLLL